MEFFFDNGKNKYKLFEVIMIPLHKSLACMPNTIFHISFYYV